MRVKLLADYSNPKRVYRPGEEIDVSDQDGARMIARKLAKPARGKKTEQAVLPRGERAVTHQN